MQTVYVESTPLKEKGKALIETLRKDFVDQKPPVVMSKQYLAHKSPQKIIRTSKGVTTRHQKTSMINTTLTSKRNSPRPSRLSQKKISPFQISSPIAAKQKESVRAKSRPTSPMSP